MAVWEIALAILAVLLGSTLQRATGMGFALFSAPFIVLLLGPMSGVALLNLCAPLASLVILARVRRDVDWRRMLVMTVAAAVGTAPALLVVLAVPGPVLEIGIGGLIVVALTATLLMRAGEARQRTSTLGLAGFASGFMNTAAGIGGPPMSIYAIATGWEQRSFAATLQPFFVVTSLLALATKAGTAPDALGAIPWTLWIGVVAGTGAGLVLGERVARAASPGTLQRLLISVAYLGGALTLARGIWTLS
ncbi:TSUP family transporter [Microbacterium sp. gxy059]|uniref:TSUP family transporter n=1 Tax=Microbacterium sp. gxy059 TaxID=2957199 RepID=UPI003D9821F4